MIDLTPHPGLRGGISMTEPLDRPRSPLAISHEFLNPAQRQIIAITRNHSSRSENARLVQAQAPRPSRRPFPMPQTTP